MPARVLISLLLISKIIKAQTNKAVEMTYYFSFVAKSEWKIKWKFKIVPISFITSNSFWLNFRKILFLAQILENCTKSFFPSNLSQSHSHNSAKFDI